MSTIAQVKQQVDRIWYATFQTDLTDTLAAHLRRHALAGVQAALEADSRLLEIARHKVVSLTEVVQGDPVRIWSEHEAANPAMSCRYSKGKVVVGNPETCPMAEFILVKSLAPGCFQSIRESVAQQGLGAPWPTGCKYE